jgi:uncharacterized protein (TIGR00369 family)
MANTGIDDTRTASIRDSFARQGMMQTLGARIDHVSPGRVVLSLPIRPAINQQHGFAHAGATFALGDSAAGYAALTMMEPGAEVLTVEMKINLIAPAAGMRLIARSTPRVPPIRWPGSRPSRCWPEGRRWSSGRRRRARA